MRLITLSFEVHTEVYDGYGDMELADRQFMLNRKSRVLSMTDFHVDNAEQSITLEGGQMAKLLRYIVHTLEVFMWEQDYSLLSDEDGFSDDFFAEEEFGEDEPEEMKEVQQKEPEGRPSWRVQVEYTNHTTQDISRICFLYGHSYRITGVPVHCLLDIFADTDDIADGTVRIFYAHIHNASTIWDAIKGGRYFYPSFSKYFSDVKRNPDICAAFIRHRFNDSLKFINFSIHIFNLTSCSLCCFLFAGHANE